jgi:hypothetical protein
MLQRPATTSRTNKPQKLHQPAIVASRGELFTAGPKHPRERCPDGYIFPLHSPTRPSPSRPRMTDTADALIRQIEVLGYAVSVHRMGDYVEMHAVFLKDPELVLIARCGDGDGEKEIRVAACELARMVGIDLEG